MTYIDLTHTFTETMPVYPGDPKPELHICATIEKDGFTDHLLKTAMHVGTHMDSPLHMISGGKHLSDIAPEHFFGPGKSIDARGHKTIGPELLSETLIRPGDILLIYTGWDKQFREANYYTDYPVLTTEFAKKALELGVKMVGLDTPSPDHEPFLVHKILLAKNILIIENLTGLEKLFGHHDIEITALPAKLHTDAAPCRVIASTLR